jgi:glycosyltransferase involved in cell wall biosynthesis
MKIALVQDGLMCQAGGEQVARCFHLAFPDAPLYTMCYQPHLTFPEFQSCDVRPSWLQHIAKTDDTMKRLFFPLGVMAMKSQDLTEYDVVLMSSTHSSKYVKVSKDALVLNHCFTPFRLAWDPTSYAEYARSSGIKRRIFDVVLSILRKIDYEAAQRTDYYLTTTEEVAERIRRYYGIKNEIEIIPSPIKAHNFHVSTGPKDYYLIVSRLEYYKKVDLVIEAFNRLGYPLVVVGKGLKAAEIKAMAGPNITFLSGLSDAELADVYANCKAFLLPQHEDFGLTALEANASGRPVIAYGAGGVLKTQIPVKDDPSRATALFFGEQTVDSLIDAVRRYELIQDDFDPYFIRRHAEQFDEAQFIERIREYVHTKYESHKKMAKRILS